MRWRSVSVSGCSPTLFTSKNKSLKFLQSHQSFTSRIWALSGRRVVYFCGNMAATKQIMRGTLLKPETTVHNTRFPRLSEELRLCFPPQFGAWTTNWTCRPLSLHCARNVWLPVLHRNPPFLCSGGQSSGVAVGGGSGVSGGTDICSWQLPRAELTRWDTVNGHQGTYERSTSQ